MKISIKVRRDMGERGVGGGGEETRRGRFKEKNTRDTSLYTISLFLRSVILSFLPRLLPTLFFSSLFCLMVPPQPSIMSSSILLLKRKVVVYSRERERESMYVLFSVGDDEEGGFFVFLFSRQTGQQNTYLRLYIST